MKQSVRRARRGSQLAVEGELRKERVNEQGNIQAPRNSGRFVTRAARRIGASFSGRKLRPQLEVDVPESDGTTTHWLVEWGTRNDLIRRGVDVDRIKVGDELTISLIMSRQLEHVGYLQSAVLSDGSTIRDCGYAAFRDALVNPQADTSGCKTLTAPK